MTAEIETWRFHQKYETTDCPRSRPFFCVDVWKNMHDCDEN